MSSFFGLYRGLVKDNDDSNVDSPYNTRARVKVYVPEVYGDNLVIPDELPWAEPCISALGGGRVERLEVGEEVGEGRKYAHGLIAIPPVGSSVWVMFEQGDPNHPVWMGTWYGAKDAIVELPDEAMYDYRTGARYPNIMILQGPYPPSILVQPVPTEEDPEPDVPRFAGMYLRFIEGRRIELVFHKDQNMIELDGDEKRIKIKATGWNVVVEARTVNAGTEEEPQEQGGDVTVQAFPLVIQPEEVGGEPTYLGANVTFFGREITISAIEDLTIMSQRGKLRMFGSEEARLSSAGAIQGAAPHASGFERH